ncbi:biotin transport system permease protein [Nakamurella panacisegetis]|uniref:Biotin transport system permease protein n=1 Tax=Nakamurella panacisegetis TaxID=1090615 RepID=A0A1H0NID9_9ACTN|nr:CbiQ family ECF transporter T component [Nakamurella panacisegetis]SDO92532.1 biotin transport system permease protein [Nakamurella panacisegetis]
MSGALLGLYRPGSTPLHRWAAGPKLAGLLGVGVATVLLTGPVAATGGFLAMLAVAASARIGVGRALRSLLPVLVAAALLAAYHLWQDDWRNAVELSLDLLTLALAATVLTATTPLDGMLDAIAGGLRPLRRFGVDPERIGLAFALMIRSVPEILLIASQTRAAAIARGVQRDPRALLTPTVIRVVARARQTGDALIARGIGDD